MIAIFTVLGLLLFGGGAFAIYDGWPYLVLERGFTEVIIGSIASGAGLIMLALAWVLREVRGTRRMLLDAIDLHAGVSLPGAGIAEAPLVAPPRVDDASVVRSVAPAAIGAAAGVAATSAVAQALAAPEDENAAVPTDVPTSSEDRDLFGALVARKPDEAEPGFEGEPEVAPEIAPLAAAEADEAEALPDMFEDVQSEPVDSGFEGEEREPAAPVAAETQSSSADEESAAQHGAPAPFGDPSSVEQPMGEQAAPPEEAVEAPAPNASGIELDEFSALRESLAGHLNEPEQAEARIEPSFSPEADPFAAAESWMDRASPRREPWLDTPSAEKQMPVAEAVPLWPPRTEAQAFDAPTGPVAADADGQTAPETGDSLPLDQPSEAEHAEPERMAGPVDAGEPQAGDAPAATDARPASDEGIVGAYQVGDAHFTIFADGSIRARTPDGEYSFGSMDELKVYLASEKSRLGV